MQANRKDIGYTIYSRLEECVRTWICGKLLNSFGNDWRSYLPDGIWDKVQDRLSFGSRMDVDDPESVLDETDIPDLAEIVFYKKGFQNFVSHGLMTREGFQDRIEKLYDIRNKIAHVKRAFSALDLDLLLNIAKDFVPIIETYGDALKETLECIATRPEKIVVQMPVGFVIHEDQPTFPHVNNLPLGDYDTDGGFIGRREVLGNITNLLLGELHRVVTISGAGGVGKTAVAHKLCQNILIKTDLPFDGIVWVSAKEEKLTVTGIEPIEPTLRNYESVLDSILQTFGWLDNSDESIEWKEESVDTILRAGDKGILLVVDNLETIRDERVKEFIKDFPPPSKVLITSRIGLGEVERRYPLKEMNSKDAITLLRTVAREKGAETLAQIEDRTLAKYVDKMSRYPLAIKWVVGQIAVGKDLELAIGDLTASTGNVAKFCFEHIFDELLNDEQRKVLYSLAANDKPLVRGVLSHISSLGFEELDSALKNLTLASLVVPTQVKSVDATVETRYELLSLTKNYIQSKLQSHTEIHRAIKNRTEMVQNLIEEADKAGKQYRYSLRHMGAETEAEKVAATLAFTAYQKFQAGDYDGAIELFKRASQIAPHFPAVYRNWATLECEARFYEKADELMTKATSLDSNDSRLWFVWGNIEKRRQRYDRAYKYINKALTLSPNDAPILGALGEVEKRKGRFKEANKLFREALDGDYSVSHTRHQLVCYTAIADNLHRWAESVLRDRRAEESLSMLEEAFGFASKAIELGKDDIRAQNSYLEACEALALHLLRSKGLESAMPYFERAVTLEPKRSKERKINQICCYHLTDALLIAGREDDARKFYNLGRRSVFPDSKYFAGYKDLNLEFSQCRSKGILYRVPDGRGYGFIEVEGESGQSIFLHMSNIVPRVVDIEEFQGMKGRVFTFIVDKNEKGLAAKRARLLKKAE